MRFSRLKITLISLAVSLATCSVVRANPDTQYDIALSNIILIMHHEIGHALVDQFGLPVIGQEEDAVDAFATLMVLETYDEPAPILLDAAATWFAFDRIFKADGGEHAYYDEHDLDIQRAYRILCIAHGYDTDTFLEEARKRAIPDERLETCEYDAALALESWDLLLADALRDSDKPAGKVSVDLAASEDYDDLRQELKDSGVMTEIAEWIDTTYDWPAPTTLAAAECGEVNAFYDSEELRITLCYEMMDELLVVAKTLDR
ncbi:DUF4344 domain-containing metallopeptidase [Hoeflea sp. AS60]|uniref:DUF4344 domain-containing metallopeptidase n=1 Tax=Hoeflea sp. AS60 TaxID=3135780 RepID=UPI003181693D